MAAHLRGRSLRRATVVAVLLGLVTAGAWSAVGESDARAQRSAMALLRVYTTPPSVLSADTAESAVARDAELFVFRNTMAALFQSHFVIEAAIRPQEIAEIEQIRSLDNPVEWVRERMEVGFLDGSEIMRVRLTDSTLEADDLEKLVDSLVDSYMRNVVDSERIEKLRKKDVLEREFVRANDVLNDQREEFIELAQQLGGGDSPTAKLQTEMLLENWRANRAERRELQNRLADAHLEHQLELVEAGAYVFSDAQVEPNQDAAESNQDDAVVARTDEGSVVAIDERELDANTRRRVGQSRAKYAIIRHVSAARIQALDEQEGRISEEIKQRSKVSAEIQQRQEHLRRQADLVDTMGRKLALWSVEDSAGSRVVLLQPAIIEEPVED